MFLRAQNLTYRACWRQKDHGRISHLATDWAAVSALDGLALATQCTATAATRSDYGNPAL
jgi:hypothetical protein